MGMYGVGLYVKHREGCVWFCGMRNVVWMRNEDIHTYIHTYLRYIPTIPT
jgi:hypothetical protein